MLSRSKPSITGKKGSHNLEMQKCQDRHTSAEVVKIFLWVIDKHPAVFLCVWICGGIVCYIISHGMMCAILPQNSFSLKRLSSARPDPSILYHIQNNVAGDCPQVCIQCKHQMDKALSWLSHYFLSCLWWTTVIVQSSVGSCVTLLKSEKVNRQERSGWMDGSTKDLTRHTAVHFLFPIHKILVFK